MRSTRTPHSDSSVSSRSYMSSRTRHRSCSRHSDPTKKPSRKMKFIIAIGIALPIVAAIIGVVAWAVSADSAFQGPIVSSLRRSDLHLENHEEDIFQALEDRHDVEFSRHFAPPNQDLEKHDFSRLDNPETHNQFDDTTNKDPLYIVHFVPSPKPKVESSSSDTSLASTVSNDVLEKILSASKGTKPGTPQFVVFAPVPEEGDTKVQPGSLDIGSQGLNLFQNRQARNKVIDYDYEEELRKYQELLDSSDRPPQKETSRVGEDKDKTQTLTDSRKETLQLISQNFTAGKVYQSHQQHSQSVTPNSNAPNSMPNNYNQQAVISQQQNLIPQLSYQQNAQGYSNNLPQGINQGYVQQPVQQGQNYDQQQQYQQQVQNYDQQQQYQQQVQNYDQQQYQQQYYPQESNQAAVQTFPQPQIQQPLATDRSGYSEPFGIKLNIGGGNGRGLLGGNYSPLGIIGSILRPLLPRAQANLNGKVMFGVVLEKGVKLGNNNKGPVYG